MTKRSASRLTAITWPAAAFGWIAFLVVVAGTVVWYDQNLGGYWDQKFHSGNLFLAQYRHRFDRKPLSELATWYPIWITIMRSEANLSVGLLAASALISVRNLVNPARNHRVWRTPGAVACTVAVVATCICILEDKSAAIKQGRSLWGWGHPILDPFPNVWPLVEMRIALAVLGAWLVMLAMGRWRPPRTWTDRIGCAVGSLWLVVMVYRVVASFFIPLGNWRY